VAKIPYFRWWIASLLFVATGLSFLDRQTLSTLAPTITRDLRLDNVAYSHVVSAFILSYTVMFTVGGRVIDRLGLRVGFAISAGIWGLASLLHSVAYSALSLGFFRFLLGVGEGGCFPGATKAALEWFPRRERALAVGLANGGSAFGAVVAPPLAVCVSLHFGWRAAFLATGGLDLLWLAAWLFFFRLPRESRFVSAEELQYITESGDGAAGEAMKAPGAPAEPLISWAKLLRLKEVWGFALARFLLDPVFYFYMFWIPQYLSQTRHIPIAAIGKLMWIPFLTLGVSNFIAGWTSDRLVRAGWSVNAARKTLLGFGAFLTPFSILCIFAPSAQAAIALMSVLMFAHGFWITNYMTLIGDLFPVKVVGSVVGLSGSAGGVGGILSSLIIGVVVLHGSYSPLFVACGLLYPLGFAVILLAIRSVRQIDFSTTPSS